MATYTFGISSTPLTGNKVFTSTDADAQLLLDWASIAYAPLIQGQPDSADFHGTINGTALTVTSVETGTIAIGQYVYGSGVAPATRITAGSGTSWTLSQPSTVSSPIAMEAHTAGQVGTQLAVGTMNAWVQAVQRMQFDVNKAAVPVPPPMGWTALRLPKIALLAAAAAIVKNSKLTRRFWNG